MRVEDRSMRPWRETVVMPADRSWLLFDRQLPAFPFNWHHHPEFELTLTLGSTGLRFVGDHVGRYGEGDLVLVGPHLPHAWQSGATLGGPLHRALVCWFTADWIEALVAGSPELRPLRRLLETAQRGAVFGEPARQQAAAQLLALVELPAWRQWLGLIEVLMTLAEDPALDTLASGPIAPQGTARERDRLAAVMAWLDAHHAEPVDLAHLAGLAHVSVSQLQRLFRRATRLSISAYVAQRRIGHACALLAQGGLPVAAVGVRAGYREPAHFTRQFRALKGCTPSQYRRAFVG